MIFHCILYSLHSKNHVNLNSIHSTHEITVANLAINVVNLRTELQNHEA
jgi:NAD+--asparagine ADP-ribosyltransferase